MTIDKSEKIKHLPTQKRRVLLSLEGNGCQIYYKAILNFIVHTQILQEYFRFNFLSLLTLRLSLCKLTS